MRKCILTLEDKQNHIQGQLWYRHCLHTKKHKSASQCESTSSCRGAWAVTIITNMNHNSYLHILQFAWYNIYDLYPYLHSVPTQKQGLPNGSCHTNTNNIPCLEQHITDKYDLQAKIVITLIPVLTSLDLRTASRTLMTSKQVSVWKHKMHVFHILTVNCNQLSHHNRKLKYLTLSSCLLFVYEQREKLYILKWLVI